MKGGAEGGRGAGLMKETNYANQEKLTVDIDGEEKTNANVNKR